MQENGLGKSSNYVPEINAGTNGSKKKKKDPKEILDADLKKAAEKKDKALAEDPSVLKQIGIGLKYRKDQGLAVLKDKSKKLLSKGKNKVYGQIDLLKNKID
tara:strand:+ start:414 stop:719 length:306 start_codon:yes stop_codon:yes gene_type:complete